jgi:hypothetical protein
MKIEWVIRKRKRFGGTSYPVKITSQSPNMIIAWDKLSTTDKIVICGCLNTMTKKYEEMNIHPATLPFVPVPIALECVRQKIKADPTKLHYRYLKILDTLLSVCPEMGSKMNTHRTIYLDDGKVARWFGLHPERGKQLTSISGSPTVSLRCIAPGVWKYQTPERWQVAVELYLLDHCR